MKRKTNQAYERHDLLLETAGRRLLVATSPRAISRVLLDRNSPWDLAGFQQRQLEPVLGGSLVLADDAQAPALRRRAAAFISGDADQCLGQLVSTKIGALVARGSEDLEADLSRAALSILVRLLFGGDLDRDEQPLTALFDRRVCHLEKFRLRSALGWPLLMSPDCSRMRLQVLAHDAKLLDMLSARSNGLRQLASTFGRREAAAMALSLLSGYKTVALTLLWSLKALSEHSELLAPLAAEAVEWRKAGHTTATLANMRHTRALMHETMRLYPAFPFLLRQTRAEDPMMGALSNDVALVSPWIVHRHKALWANPLAFSPERFLKSAPSSLSFLPFGFGQRRCLGANLGERVIIASLLTIAAREQQVVVGDAEPFGSFLLRPRRRVSLR
ncbi:Epi-isozizaene 5-monooxygenase/(E)-beta-farnesene synthase [compost metagenome]